MRMHSPAASSVATSRRSADREIFLTPAGRTLCRGEVGELGVALEERELDRIGGAVPVLGDDQLRDPLLLRLFAVVVLVAVDEADEVCVLLDRARLAQI